jgi:hypothetical protein
MQSETLLVLYNVVSQFHMFSVAGSNLDGRGRAIMSYVSRACQYPASGKCVPLELALHPSASHQQDRLHRFAPVPHSVLPEPDRAPGRKSRSIMMNSRAGAP